MSQESVLTSLQNTVHRNFALNRRIRVLAREIAALIPDNCSLLDIGTGSGEIALQVTQQKRGCSIRAIDTVCREDCQVPVDSYNGEHIPFAAGDFDYVMLIDVLHHTLAPLELMREAFRVARHAVIIKDHVCDSRFARTVMTATDWFANRQHGVSLPYNFWSTAQWRDAWKNSLAVAPEVYRDDFGLYPWISYLLFSRKMDFIAKLPTPKLSFKAQDNSN